MARFHRIVHSPLAAVRAHRTRRLAWSAAALVLAGWLCTAAAENPPGIDALDGGRPEPGRHGGLAAWERTGDPAAGAVAYEACVVCHGEDGGGRADGTFPRLAGQHASVVAKQISDIQSGRRGNPIMASHLTTLTDPQEMADLAAFIALMPDPAPPDPVLPDPATSEDVTAGRLLYARDCARCHGDRGQGDAEAFVPLIAGQHRGYVLRQLRAIAGSLRRNAHPGMVETVFDYRDDELRDLASYVSSLPWPTRSGPR